MRVRHNEKSIASKKLFDNVEDMNDQRMSVGCDGSAQRQYLKQQLFWKSASCDRGFGASSKERESILGIIRNLQTLAPNLSPTAGLFPDNSLSSTFESAPIEGVWKMVYTSALDVLSLAANPVSQLQGIYQVSVIK